MQYLNGWPHCSLTAPASAGDTTLVVDDCTGWAPQEFASNFSTDGAAGVIYDPGVQETASVTAASVASGPGTLTITPALSYAHTQGTLYSALPDQLHWASILYGISQALTRGATATTPQTISPSGVSTGGGQDAMVKAAAAMVHPFRRVR